MVHGPEGQLPTPTIAVRRWHVARWQVGLAAPADAPRSWVEDALTGRVAVVHREPGAGSQAAFERARAASAPPLPLHGPRVAGHAEAAWRAVTDGIPAVTIEPAALANGLAFHPLEAHTCELLATTAHADDPLLHAFLEELISERVARRLAAIGGYDLSGTGTELAA